MKHNMMIVVALLFFIIHVNSQNNESELKFTTKYYEAVDKWVALPPGDTDSTYHYGFIYIDDEAGFTYHIGSEFYIDDSNHYVSQEADTTFHAKYRIDPNWTLVTIIPDDIRSELNLPEEPEWLKYYKEESESTSYLKNIGYHYNHAGASALALSPLLKAYAQEPHFKGLEFELSYAYNALGDYENAIKVLEMAIENDPANFFFYRELGFAFKNMNQIDMAESTYKKGIELSDNDFEKSEMAVNMAQSYYQVRNKEKFDEWAALTRLYAEDGSRYEQFIDLFEEKWDEN
ncbi:tetratricopeptide repeat protein [Robertkochia solimangrovi]|uniref:tetratricopeptide repeat protein n=1 Tax=Robertkochia solimangrovi TaxID=2213046 RepID=UPI00117EABEF|nr:tetratricopeptide repeat protein [Robertkochia solimangrovi]